MITICLPVFGFVFTDIEWQLWQLELIFWHDETGWHRAGGRNWGGCGRGKTKFQAMLDYLRRGFK